MRFSIDVGSELELKLYQAVLLYKNDHGNRYMATVHGVVQQNGDGSPILGAWPEITPDESASIRQPHWHRHLDEKRPTLSLR
jgi:hypothetical protein